MTGGRSSRLPISTGRAPPKRLECSEAPPSHPRLLFSRLSSAMKQTLSELMRMSRICRMVLATCLGSFILVIFYFQIMRRNPFVAEGCCGKGTRSALRELYDPSQPELSGPAVLHQSRRDRVADACRANSASSRKRRVLTPGDLKHLVVDEEHELLYCYVPKVACTNWKRVMMVLTGHGKYSDPMEIPSNEAHVPSNLKTLNQYSIAEINRRLKTYLKFLFVREPFERLVSAYRNKFTLKYNSSFHKRFGTRIVRRYRKNATAEALANGADVTFKEFAEYLADPATRRDGPLNEHWQTVYQLCHPCHIRYDLVGKYETLEDDANYVLRLAGEALRFPSYAKSTRTTDAMTAQFFANVSTEQRQRLYQLYKLDFLMFNYSTPAYLRLD
ncbi:carbohydrate sulfotransferase 11 isoform X2 [Corythoichthys intestinalis]|uniref:carbohydrate sulfotransferase 11 isoform X2 n=1 Tax=Corythoichthys intestinalis TaxID=161448 RepID=UPI0025A50C67|nr:carbohydrate sulfotransferase 11 isoform X2 [Corythoichthys intestinalis]